VSKIRINKHPFADSYALHDERIIEFSSGETQDELAGGLISFMRLPDGRLRVELYQLDENVTVVAPPERLAGG
jgi:hypothetical protein